MQRAVNDHLRGSRLDRTDSVGLRLSGNDPGCVKRAFRLVPLGRRATFAMNRQRSDFFVPLESRANRNTDRICHLTLPVS